MSIVQFGLIAAVSTPFALSVWVAYVRRPAVLANEGGAREVTVAFDLTPTSFAAETLDLEPAVLAAAHALHREARAHSVRVEVAVDAKLKVRVDPKVLGTALRAIVLTALHATPGGQVLITGMTLGGQSHIRVTDDGKDTDQRAREGLTRGAEALIALQGGSVGVEVRPGRATTVIIRLPLPADRSGECNEVPAMVEQAA